jgi:hypothetical protein
MTPDVLMIPELASPAKLLRKQGFLRGQVSGFRVSRFQGERLLTAKFAKIREGR